MDSSKVAVIEGETELIVPRVNEGQTGPGKIDKAVSFYNPAMRPNRDLAVLTLAVLQAEKSRGIDIADPLAGTGARALRLANELASGATIHANDADATSMATLHEHKLRLGLDPDSIQESIGGAHGFLASRRFDAVDVDPFGSPAPFLDAAMMNCRHDGLLLITATDTGCLSGTFPSACWRRYGSNPYHLAPWRQEVGLRILLANLVRSAGRFERAIEPVWSLAAGHWMRVVVRVRDGRGAAKLAHRQVQQAQVDEREQLSFGQGTIGPIWSGPLHDKEFLGRMLDELGRRDWSNQKQLQKTLDSLYNECDGPPSSTDLGHLQRLTGLATTPKRQDLIQALRELGCVATTTHLDPQSIRTDASLEQMLSAYKQLV